MPNDIVVRSDKNGGKVHLSADRVYDLNEDKTQDVLNDEFKDALETIKNGLAIIVDGDTCSIAVPVGWYAYIRNNTHGLAEGWYINRSASAFPTSGGTADGTVFLAVIGGSLNVLNRSLEWTFSQKQKGTTAVSLPAPAHEYLIVLRYGTSSAEQTMSFIFTIPNDSRMFGITPTQGYYLNNTTFAFAQLSLTTTGKVKIQLMNVSGTDYSATSYIYIYYR